MTAEANFGATYGLKTAYIKSQAVNPSSAGIIRLGSTESISWRNNANNGNLALTTDSSDNLLFNAKTVVFSGLIVNADISPSAAIAYSKLNLATSILNSDISTSAAIAYSKLAALTASRVLVSDGSGVVSASSVTSTTLSYLDATSSIQTQLNSKEPSITTLPIAKGGTNNGSLGVTSGGIIYTDGSKLVNSGAGTSGQILVSNGSSAPSWITSAKVLQVVDFSTGAVATGTSTVPMDDTIPQITEGNQYMSLAITPISASSVLYIDVTFISTTSTSSIDIVSLFRDSTANAIATAFQQQTAADISKTISFSAKVSSSSTSSTTFTVRAGPHVAGTMTFNGRAGARSFGGVMASSIRITEVL